VTEGTRAYLTGTEVAIFDSTERSHTPWRWQFDTLYRFVNHPHVAGTQSAIATSATTAASNASGDPHRLNTTTARDDSPVWLKATNETVGIGDVLLSLEKSIAGVQQVSPVPPAIEPWIAARAELVGSAVTEFEWPFLDSRQRNWTGHEIEPGEAVAFDFDLWIPANTRHVLVYSYFRNVTKPGDIGWNTSTVYEVADAASHTTSS
jgi:hypothetical protein